MTQMVNGICSRNLLHSEGGKVAPKPPLLTLYLPTSSYSFLQGYRLNPKDYNIREKEKGEEKTEKDLALSISTIKALNSNLTSLYMVERGLRLLIP